MKSSLMLIFTRLLISFSNERVMWLYDHNDQPYLDALSSIGMINLRHSHPAIVETITTQAKKLIHTSNTYIIEVAIKMARLRDHKRGIKCPGTITFQGDFHGKAFGYLSALGNSTLQKSFEPFLEDFTYLPFSDIQAAETAIVERKLIVDGLSIRTLYPRIKSHKHNM